MIVPGSPNALLLAQSGDPLDEYGKIERSLRTRSSAAGNLSRTPVVSSTDPRTWTLSCWLKRGSLSQYQTLICAGNSDTVAPMETRLRFSNDGMNDILQFIWNGNTVTGDSWLTSTAFRDPASHMHVVLGADIANATRASRLTLEIDGQVVPLTPSGNTGNSATTAWMTSTYALRIAAQSWNAQNLFDGLLSHVAFVDGVKLSASAFGKRHPRTNQWRPLTKATIRSAVKAASVSARNGWGTNGFFLPFDDISSVAALGYDRSQSDTDTTGNNFTPNNISLTPGPTYDAMLDTPTNNFATLNNLKKGSTENPSDGNLKITSGASHDAIYLTHKVPLALPVYFELVTGSVTTGSSTSIAAGVSASSRDQSVDHGLSVGGWNIYLDSFIRLNNNGSVLSAASGSLPSGTVVQVAIDWPEMWVGVGNTWYDSAGGTTGNPATGANPTFTLAATDLTPWVECYNNNATVNCGQQPWAATCPAGFSGYGTKNLPFPKIAKSTSAFVAVTDTGANITATLAAARVGWPAHIDIIKRRDPTAEGWRWIFSDDPATYLDSSSTAAKAAVPSFPGTAYVGYSLQVAASNGVATGRLTHVIGTADVVPDGLSNSRKMVFLKNEASGTWYVYHPDLTAGKLLYFEQAAGETTDATISTVLSNSFVVAAALASGTYRWIAIAETVGFISLGSYAANTLADGPFCNCDSPSFVMIKNLSAGAGFTWPVYDSARGKENPTLLELLAGSSSAETSMSDSFDKVSNGFKIRARVTSTNNVAGNKHIYLSIAAFPVRYANAR